jgi:DNA-binding FrmR family transcriptional regulator
MPAPDRADARPVHPERGSASPPGASARATSERRTHGSDGRHGVDGHRGSADSTFRHSYSKDKAQLVRRLSRIEGQVRGIARMIERDEYCVDILQQTSALRAAVDALAIMVLEDHVQGCVRTAAERGQADEYVTEVLEVVRRTLGRPIRGNRST